MRIVEQLKAEADEKSKADILETRQATDQDCKDENNVKKGKVKSQNSSSVLKTDDQVRPEDNENKNEAEEKQQGKKRGTDQELKDKTSVKKVKAKKVSEATTIALEQVQDKTKQEEAIKKWTTLFPQMRSRGTRN